MTFVGLGGIGIDVDYFLRVHTSLQRGHPHYCLENGARHVVLVGGAILLGVHVHDVLPFRWRYASHITAWVERRRGGHRQNVPRVHVHDDRRPARVRTEDSLQGALGYLLEAEINREHHVRAWLGRTPDVLCLAVAGVVHEDRFRSRRAAQLLVETALDPDIAAVIRQPK